MSGALLRQQLRDHAGLRPDALFLDGALRLTYAEADEAVQIRARSIADVHGGDGPVWIAGPADGEWVISVLACGELGLTAILPPSAEGCDPARWTDVATPSVAVAGGRAQSIGLASEERRADWAPPDVAVAFATSGTTGERRLVLRSHGSLVDEGDRYRRLWSLDAGDRILIAPPLEHAYGFGAGVAAALAAGCCLVPSIWRGPRTLAADLVRYRPTVLPLVAPLASAVASFDCASVYRGLRTAMVGAGRPSATTATRFLERFGVRLWHNYGSSETGAILAARDPKTPGCTGEPMAGVELTIVGGGGQGQLWVRLSHPPVGYATPRGFEPARLAPDGWWSTGDLFARDAHGCYTILGRLSDVIRRGGRTINPREVEAVLLTHPDVDDVAIRGGRGCVSGEGADGRASEDEELIDAHVQVAVGAPTDPLALRAHAAERLAAFKVPHRWHFHDQLPRGWSSKVAPAALGSAASPPALASRHGFDAVVESLTAYRDSEALFCAHELGVLDALAGASATASQLAARLSLDASALELFLDVLVAIGALRRQGSRYGFDAPQWDWTALWSLERRLRDGWLRADAIAAVLRSGVAGRPFERAGPDAAFSEAYVAALCGPAYQAAGELLARSLPAEGGAVVEIGRAIGAVAAVLGRRRPRFDVDLIALPPLPPLIDRRSERDGATVPLRDWHELALPGDHYDLVVLTNAVHWLRPDRLPGTLREIRAALRDHGRLAIVDIFVAKEPSSSERRLVLDWLTHGGTYWCELAPLLEALVAHGFEVPQVRRFGALYQHLIVTRPQQPAAASMGTPVANSVVREVAHD